MDYYGYIIENRERKMYKTSNNKKYLVGGQKCEVLNKNLILKIDAPFFSAGKKFRWEYKNPIGFGINKEIFDFCLKSNLRLAIQWKNKTYTIDAASVLKKCKKNNWTWICNFTELYIVPFAELERKFDDEKIKKYF